MKDERGETREEESGLAPHISRLQYHSKPTHEGAARRIGYPYCSLDTHQGDF